MQRESEHQEYVTGLFDKKGGMSDVKVCVSL